MIYVCLYGYTCSILHFSRGFVAVSESKLKPAVYWAHPRPAGVHPVDQADVNGVEMSKMVSNQKGSIGKDTH